VSDLYAGLRALLAGRTDRYCEGGEVDCGWGERTATDDALYAVLELHKPTSCGESGKVYNTDGSLLMTVPALAADVMCGECDSNHDPVFWPCRTVRVVAQALGVEL
jgi:hypothetical protein